jgi:hypothetical protein
MECEELKSSIIRWFGGEIDCRQDNLGLLTAVLPVFQPNGDAIEVGIEPLASDKWRISDLGIVHETLYLSGIDLTEESERTDEFQQIITDYGTTDTGSEIVLTASGNLAESVFDFIAALQSALALQFTIKPKLPARDFASIVAKFLAEQRTSFTIPSQPIDGKTGKWRFNFSLNEIADETLIKALTATTPAAAMIVSKQSVFEIRDVRELQPKRQFVAVIDDEDERESLWKNRVTRVFDGYDIPVIPFMAGRDRLIELARHYGLREN